MKKAVLILIVGVIFALASYAADTVSSANIVGYVKIDLIPGQYTLAGVNFTANGENPTLIDILGTNQLTASENYLFADRVSVWNNQTQTYQYYAMYTDHQFYPCNTRSEWDNAATPTNPVLPVGTGFWITPASGATITNEVYLSGDIVTVETNAVPLAEGYQMISYPFSSDQSIAMLNTANLTSNANYLFADRIAVWEGNHYQFYGLYTDGNWYPCNNKAEWDNSIEETDRIISIGEGFWFIAQSATPLSETNKYLSVIQ
jgi:hypothetical protein